MKIRQIRIGQFRNLRNIEIIPDPDASIVCLVGSNGSGKSNLLDLVAKIANLLGLTPGFAGSRGEPLVDYKDINCVVEFPESIRTRLVTPPFNGDATAWDRTITFVGTKPMSEPRILAGGYGVPLAEHVGQQIINSMRMQNEEVHFLRIDSDRSYSSVQQNLGAGPQLQGDYESLQARREAAYQTVSNQYANWIQYVFRREFIASTARVAAERDAKARGEAVQPFEDPWDRYNQALQSVLPHLRFVTASYDARSLVFAIGDNRLNFEGLSGGEREIAFIVGQIERFQLSAGLLAIDEPELHLNPDLVYKWISYLREGPSAGQVWIATHSLEAVDAALSDNTFVLKRDESLGLTTVIERLSSVGSYRTIADALGYPAFAIERNAYILIEGERADGIERDRFLRLAPASGVRYLESRSASEVISRFRALRDVAEAEDRPLKVGGVVDRDLRQGDDINELRASGLFVWPYHEIENLFLQPEALAEIAMANGIAKFFAMEEIRAESDRRAGSWIHQFTSSRLIRRPEASPDFRRYLSGLSWGDIDGTGASIVETAVGRLAPLDAAKGSEVRAAIISAVDAYRTSRLRSDFWENVSGKPILKALSSQLGYRNTQVLERQIMKLWSDGGVSEPTAIEELRAYVRTIAS